MHFARFQSLAVLCLMTITAQAADGQDMAFPGEQWTHVAPESQQVDSSRLQKAVRFLENYIPGRTGAQELVIIRNGYMIWGGPNTDRA